MQQEISKNRLNYYDELFSQYPTLPKRINLRKAELMVRETDENIGGGKSNIRSKPIETQVIKELSDRKLQWLELQLETVYNVLLSLDDEKAKLVRMKYEDNHGLDTWADVAKKLHYSTATVYRMRYTILELFANLLGLENTLDV